jgi:RNA polymerase sigma-70 factor (ECF subfamily)
MLTEAKLVRQAQSGDATAFLLLYQRYRKGICGFAHRLLGSQAAAEDVTHDCFAAVIASFQRFNPDRASLKTYLYAMARNLIRKHLRDPDNESSEEIPEDLATQAGPLDRLLDSELCDIVRTAIGRLPPLQREVLVLCEYEDLPLAEIAAIVDADLGTVKARLHRARSNLKRILAPYLNGDRDSQLVEDR